MKWVGVLCVGARCIDLRDVVRKASGPLAAVAERSDRRNLGPPVPVLELMTPTFLHYNSSASVTITGAGFSAAYVTSCDVRACMAVGLAPELIRGWSVT